MSNVQNSIRFTRSHRFTTNTTDVNINSMINLIHDKIDLKQETIAESLILSNISLATSNNLSTILISTHDIVADEDLFKLMNILLEVLFKNPRSKIIAVVPDDPQSIHYSILSRFPILRGVLRTNRLMRIDSFIELFGITKIYYASVLLNQYANFKSNINKYHMIRINHHDNFNAHSIFNPEKGVIISCSCDSDGDITRIRKIINKIQYPHILFSNTPIESINCPQLTHSGYWSKDFKQNNDNVEFVISSSIGLMNTYPKISITPDKSNIFDLIAAYL